MQQRTYVLQHLQHNDGTTQKLVKSFNFENTKTHSREQQCNKGEERSNSSCGILLICVIIVKGAYDIRPSWSVSTQ